MSESSKQYILNELEPLFERAKKEKLWFFSSYRSLWFSPNELRLKLKNGQFIWGAVNWKLRSPLECLSELEKIAKDAVDAENRFRDLLKENGYL